MLKPCEDKTSVIKYPRFALDTSVCDKPSKMIVNFLCNEKKYRYEVHFNNTAVIYELLQCRPFGVDARPHKVYERTLDTGTMVSKISWGEKYRSVAASRDLTVNLLPNRTVFGSFQKSNVDIPWMKEIVDWAASYILPTVITGEQHLFDYTTDQILSDNISKDEVAHLLMQADSGISGITVKEELTMFKQQTVDGILNNDIIPDAIKERVRKNPIAKAKVVTMAHHGKQGDVMLDYNQESNGTKRLYELSSIMLKLATGSHFVTIDELDNKLHPDLYQHFIDTFLMNARHSQLVFTTHIREFLDDRDLFRDDAVWFTEKDDYGATELYSLADFDTSVLRKTTNRLNAYRAGRLGALPRLGDTYIGQSNTGEQA